MTASKTTAKRVSSSTARDDAIRRFFELAREGLYIGWLSPANPGAAGVVLAANPCLKRLLGYSAEAAESTVALFAPAHYADPSSRARLVGALLRGTDVNDYLVPLRRLDGAAVLVEVTAHTEPSTDGTVRVDALLRDVSERHQLDDRARALYKELAHSEQLAAIGRTIADVAHELRNPLSTIVGWAERLAEGALDDKTRRGVSEILSASERASRIVHSSLRASGKRPTTRSMVDLNAIVEGTLVLRQHDQRAMNIVTTTELQANPPAVFADAHQIQQVLLNVILNAEQAMTTAHGRGALVIRTMADEQRHLANIEVSDDGPGVPESVRSRIFDPFFTTKHDGAGTGLGLAVAQALVHDHGGSIRLARDRAKGETFVIELPTGDQSAATDPSRT